jgi:hypothetical protein
MNADGWQRACSWQQSAIHACSSAFTRLRAENAPNRLKAELQTRTASTLEDCYATIENPAASAHNRGRLCDISNLFAMREIRSHYLHPGRNAPLKIA